MKIAINYCLCISQNIPAMPCISHERCYCTSFMFALEQKGILSLQDHHKNIIHVCELVRGTKTKYAENLHRSSAVLSVAFTSQTICIMVYCKER